jgi:hypothetical protein
VEEIQAVESDGGICYLLRFRFASLSADLFLEIETKRETDWVERERE